MQARFLLGPAGSGKTFRCLAEIRAALAARAARPFDGKEKHAGESPAPLILLAPKQATFQLERQLLAGDGICGYTRLQILSFERLARFVLEKASVAPPPLLSEEGRVMVLRALLLRHEDKLKLFRRSAQRPGFAQEISTLLNEFQQHQLAPARLRALSQRDGMPAELRDKLHDLALLHENYSLWLDEHGLQDASRLLDLASGVLRQKTLNPRLSTLNFAALWLDGFAEMTPQELDLLAAVIPRCERASLAFCLDESSVVGKEISWLSIWNAVGNTYQQCRQRMENQPDCQLEIEMLPRQPECSRFAANCTLAALEKGWALPVQALERRPLVRREEVGVQASACAPADRLKPELQRAGPETGAPADAIRIAACANADAEAAFAAREILKFVRDGNRFRDCAVLVRDLENYHQPLARTFRRYEIPCFLDRRESVAHHPLAELTRSTARTVAFDWQPTDWFAALKAGFAPVEENEIDRLENAALEFGWRGKKWREPLPEDSLEHLRRKILPPFENFAARLAQQKGQPTGEQLADALRNLWDELHVERTLDRWTVGEENSALRAPHSALHQTVFEQMNLWVENLALAFPREPLPLRDWLPIIEAGLAGLTAGVIPPVLDEVLVGAVDRARNPDLKFTLVLGVNEGIFPAAFAAPAILTDADRDALEQAGAGLGPDLRERLARERYYGYIACTRASEKLDLAFSRHDADGGALYPSPFITHLKRIFPALKIEEFQNQIAPDEAEHANELAPLLAKCSERQSPIRRVSKGNLRAGPEAGVPPGWERLLENPALKSLADQLVDLREPDATEQLSPALAETIFGPVLQTSVSRLEEFAQCPFKFFVRSGLRAGERKLFELDARERGSFQHEVLKMFHEQLTAEGKRWRDLTPAGARARISEIAAGLVENFHDGLMRDSAQSRFEAQAMTELLQDFIEVIVSWMRGQYEFDPAAAELDFGSRESPETALEIDLGNGHRLALRGRIDRIDLCRDGNRALAVVMDYKSGGKKLDALLMEHGVQLQLPAYLNVLRHWKNPRAPFNAGKLVPAGVFYVNLRGRFDSGKTRDEVLGAADARKLAYRHNGRFDAGALPKLDRTGAADQFNYRLNQDGSLRKGSVEALPPAEFEKMLEGVETRLKEMGRAIFSGEASVDPYRRGAETPCDFCDYRAACRIDPWTHQWRVLRAAKETAE